MFRIGDRVRAFGNKGVVHSLSKNGMFINVKFCDFDSLVVFYTDGKICQWHKNPSLKKVKKNAKADT
jgi:hypothetical protein